MKVFEKSSLLNEHLASLKKEGRSIGFVPTMGALHQGHMALIRIARERNDVVVCSIFVNPVQFNDPKDLERYPRTIERDTDLLENEGCDILFFPSEKEIYPDQPCEPGINLGMLDSVMEGSHRPGHFKGVATVVKRLFEIVKPDDAYFGLKDFQQVAVIREMVRQLKLDVNIVACPTIRESDGLAMSSRNTLLSDDERKLAPVVFKTLSQVKENILNLKISQLHDLVRKNIEEKGMSLEYFEIADETTLEPVVEIASGKTFVGCIAVRLGKVRLIDNIILNT